MKLTDDIELLRTAWSLADQSPDTALRDKHLGRLQRAGRATLAIGPDDVAVPRFGDGAEFDQTQVRSLLSRLRREGPQSLSKTPRIIAPLLDPDSAHAFSMSVLDAWLRECDPREKWAIYQLAVFAKPRAFDGPGGRLGELASARRHQEAVWWIDAMARHGSDRAHSWIYHWALGARPPSLRRAATDMVLAICQARDESLEEFEARVDAFILDRVLDHEFVALDRPYERDIASMAARLEEAMIGRRTWAWADLQAQLRRSARLAEMCSALVFMSEDLRFTIDPDFARAMNLASEPIDLADGAVRVAHPADLDVEVLGAWRTFMSRRDGDGPFSQLERAVIPLALVGAENQRPRPQDPTRRLGTTIELSRLRRLFDTTPWRPGATADAGAIHHAYRPFRGHGLTAVLTHSPYYVAGESSATVELESLGLRRFPDEIVWLDSAEPIVASELALDLATLTEPTS